MWHGHGKAFDVADNKQIINEQSSQQMTAIRISFDFDFTFALFVPPLSLSNNSDYK